MKRWLAWSLAGTLAAFGLVSLSTAGCGGSASQTGEGGPDTGMGMDTSPPPPDHHSPDGGMKDTGSKKDVVEPFDVMDSGPPTEGGPAPPDGGVQLVNDVTAGLGAIQIVGVTDDSQNVIYFGSTSTTAAVYAVPVAGGTPTLIFKGTSAATNPTVVLTHSTVFVWTATATNSTTGNSIGTLTAIWTSATGVVTLSPSVPKSVAGLVATSPDGTLVAYTSGVNPGGTYGNLVVASTDGTTLPPKTLLTNTATNATQTTTTYFDPQLEFVTNGYLVMTHQEVVDAGTSPLTVSSWDTTAWGKTDLQSGLYLPTGQATPYGWSTATSGANMGVTLAFADTTGNLLTVPTAGPATPVTVDTGVSRYFMLNDANQTILYGTTGGGYKSCASPWTTPASILATGFGGFINGCSAANEGCSPISESPDNQYTIYYKNQGMSGGKVVPGEFDINLINDVTPAGVTQLLSAATGAVFNDAFTADSKYGLYYSSFKEIGSPIFGSVGTLWAYKADGTGAAVPGTAVSKNAVWLSNSLTGSKVVYSDNTVPNTSTATGVPSSFSDIKVVDVSASTLKPQTVMDSTDNNLVGFYVTEDRTNIIWVMSQGNTSTNGLWAFAP